MKKMLVVFSGGQDSTTCLYWAKEQAEEVVAVTFNYGQRHMAEIDSAIVIAKKADVQHIIIQIGDILRGSSPLVNPMAMLEQYENHKSLPGGLEKTFVPGRNLLFLTLAANVAHSLGIVDIVTGVCEEDYGGYPDCRQGFITSAEQTIRSAMSYDEKDVFNSFKIHTPLMNLNKASTVWMAKNLGDECWNALAWTHTAYDGQYPPMGNDHATLLREKGFLEAGLPDPLVLRAVSEGLMPLPETNNYAIESDWQDYDETK